MKTGLLLLLSIAALALFMLALKYYGMDIHVYRLLEHIKESGIYGQLIFAVIVAGSVIFMLPSVMFTIGAGYLFGVAHGSTLVVVSETLGATIAFLIARHGVGAIASEWLLKKSKLANVSESMLSQGWRVIAAFRMIPFFPFRLSNYFFGLLPVSLGHYVLGTFVGLWPITLFNVYLGSIASDLMSLSISESMGEIQQSRRLLIYAIGLSIGIGAILYLSRVARKTLSAMEVASGPSTGAEKSG